MKLLTKAIENKLIANSKENMKTGESTIDFKPVLKLFGGSAFTYLFTEYDPETDLFFGLCDIGQGFPEIGYASRAELEAIRFPPFHLPIERDGYFSADKTLSQYADEARDKGAISC